MPELGVNNLVARWPHPTIPRVVKTHQRYRIVFGRKVSIGIIRDPRDVMVSYYHFTHDRKRIYSGSFAQFIRHPRYGLPSWFAHYKSWHSRWSVVVRFEDMVEEPFRELRRVLDVLDVQPPDELVDEAVSRASLGALRRAESPETAKDQYGGFTRSGTIGQWNAYFSDEDSAHYVELAKLYGAGVYV
jgi:estrone sulfotransferase